MRLHFTCSHFKMFNVIVKLFYAFKLHKKCMHFFFMQLFVLFIRHEQLFNCARRVLKFKREMGDNGKRCVH